jgi:hypothetical protein
MLAFNQQSPTSDMVQTLHFVGESCRNGYLNTVRQLKYWSGHFDLCLGEFGKIGDSEEELADPIQRGEAIAFLFPHLPSLLVFPFYNPDTINLHVLMVLSIGGIVNALLLPEVLISKICS